MTWTPAIERRRPELLQVPERNPREHSQAQIDMLVRAIEEYGFTRPVVVDADGVVNDGVGRTLAARQMGLETVPVIVADHLSEPEARAYAIAVNRLAEMSEWDGDRVEDLVAGLEASGLLAGYELGLDAAAEPGFAPPPIRPRGTHVTKTATCTGCGHSWEVE